MHQHRHLPEVEDLISQLNPHFINNALQWLQLRMSGDEQAMKMISKLAENFSMVFKENTEDYAQHTLVDELKLMDNYLFIQRCRYGDRLEYQMPDRKEWSSYSRFQIPISSCVRIVEEAIENRIRSRKDGTGKLTVSLEHIKEGVKMIIEDDGIAFRKSRISRLLFNDTAIQKINQKDAGDKKGYWITDYEEGIFSKDSGTRVTIYIPI